MEIPPDRKPAVADGCFPKVAGHTKPLALEAVVGNEVADLAVNDRGDVPALAAIRPEDFDEMIERTEAERPKKYFLARVHL